jgi:hypothetical protein
MIKIIVEIFIGDVKEDQTELKFTNDVDLEAIREVKRAMNRFISNKIKNDEWREPNFAGEYAVSLKLISNDLNTSELERIEQLANSVY